MKKLFKLTLIIAFSLMANTSQAQEKWTLKNLQDTMAHASRPTILNFWATFCKPCLEEMPYFDALASQYKKDSLQLIFVSLDGKSVYPKLKAFIAKRKIRAKVVFLDESNADLFCPAVDSSWSGVIPATVFIHPQKGYKHFFEEQLKPAQLKQEIMSLLGK